MQKLRIFQYIVENIFMTLLQRNNEFTVKEYNVINLFEFGLIDIQILKNKFSFLQTIFCLSNALTKTLF